MRPRDELGPIDLHSLDVEGGFVARITPQVAESLRALFDGAPVDPEVDRRITEWRCPGCGRGMDELADGHAWSYDSKTRQYRCDDPPYPGGPTQFTMDCGLSDLAGAEADLLVPWERR